MNQFIVLIYMMPAQLILKSFFIYLVNTCSHEYFYQKAWNIWEFNVHIHSNMTIFLWICWYSSGFLNIISLKFLKLFKKEYA